MEDSTVPDQISGNLHYSRISITGTNTIETCRRNAAGGLRWCLKTRSAILREEDVTKRSAGSCDSIGEGRLYGVEARCTGLDVGHKMNAW